MIFRRPQIQFCQWLKTLAVQKCLFLFCVVHHQESSKYSLLKKKDYWRLPIEKKHDKHWEQQIWFKRWVLNEIWKRKTTFDGFFQSALWEPCPLKSLQTAKSSPRLALRSFSNLSFTLNLVFETHQLSLNIISTLRTKDCFPLGWSGPVLFSVMTFNLTLPGNTFQAQLSLFNRFQRCFF